MKRNNKKGFTIIELVVVIAVIAILAAVLIPTFSSIIKKANESVDIQAAKNMNTFLATADITDGVDSILDVYDVFEESDYIVENYAPLYKGRSYYYSVEDNMVLYLDTDGNVIYPEGKITTGKTILSLNLSCVEGKQPSTYSEVNSEIKATVTNAAEYVYVIEAYNKASEGSKLTLTIDGTIDMKGGECYIKATKGDVTISGTNNAVIKNVTSTTAVLETTDANGKLSSYNVGTLILESGHNVTISNITFENLNIKNVYAGNVGFLVSRMKNASTKLSVNGVTIKDSTLIAHRNAGAFAGLIQNATVEIADSKLENVRVKTVGGRSGLLMGAITMTNSITFKNVTWDSNSSIGIYNNAASKQQFSDTKPTYDNSLYEEEANNFINAEKYISSLKNESATKLTVYGFSSQSLYCIETKSSSEWTIVTSLTQN